MLMTDHIERYIPLSNICDILLRPSKAFVRLQTQSLSQAYRHYFLLLVFYTLFLGIVSIITTYFQLNEYQSLFGTVPVLGHLLVQKAELFLPFFLNWSLLLVYLWFLYLMFMIFVKGFFLHVFVLILGGDKGVTMTLRAILYASTPYLLLGWIPYIGCIALVWSVFLFIMGIKQFQDFSWGKAAATILIPLLLLVMGLVIDLYLGLLFLQAASGMFISLS